MSRLVDQSLGKPIQGVSQQAEALRGKGQCNEQINFLPDPVAGLRRRPPTAYIRTLLQYSRYIDYIDADGDKILCIGTSDVDVYDPIADTLTEVSIIDADAHTYLKAGMGAVKMRAAFVEDALYVSNSTVTVLEDTGYTPPTRITDVGILTCLGGQYARTYTVNITIGATTYTYSYTTPDGTTAGDIDKIAASYILNELKTDINAATIGVTAVQSDDHLLIYETSATVISITCSDDEGNLALKCAYNTVKGIEDLPEKAPANTVITVAGEAGSEDDSYFEFKLTNSSDTGYASFGQAGVWVESVKIGDEFAFDNTTLPVKIADNGGTLELTLVDWKGREIGDAESNETPSILDNRIVDITSIQGRLGLLSERSVLFSRTKRPTELWRRSIVGGIQNDDAIDGSGDSSTGVHTHFAKNAQDLAVFTKQGQYVILGNQALTPDSVNLTLTTRNTSVEEVAPIGVAGNLYYVTDNGDYMGMSEYFKEDLTYFSFPISNHIPRYIEGRATLLRGSNPQQMLAMQTSDNLKRLYCYKFLFSGKNRVQSAWFKMEFLKDIKHFMFTGNSMIIISDNTTEHLVERMDFDKIITSGLDFEVHLDLSKEYTLDVDNQITVDAIHQSEDILFISLDSESAGLPVEYTDLGGGVYEMVTGSEGNKVVAGYRYTSTYSPTAPRYFDRDNEVVQTGTLNVRNLLVNVADSGVFSWAVQSNYGTLVEGDLSNRVWGDANNLIGSEPLYTRQWSVPWRGKNTDKTCTLTCDRHTPLNISYIEFIGDLRKIRSRI